MKTAHEKPIQHFASDDDKFCVYEVLPRSRKTIYYVRGSQTKYVDKITLLGYQGLPPGLYLNRKGYGPGKKGVFLLSALKQHFSSTKKLELNISSKDKKSVKKANLTIAVTLPYVDVRNLLVRLGRINEDNNNELREAVGSFLSTKFPRQIKVS